ncbi:hypothetical protein [Streptomyces barkulensis]|uniref:hypothetical protein n=1 Tax=Streptomyces barkulensis TaxID=1257026 RepID=UPI001F0D6D36|nr:hypothetical protein [Streptomyces barkulensis]
MFTDHLLIGAPEAVQGITGGQILGAITLSGLALAAGIILVLGVRGSDRIKLNTKERTGGAAIVTGILWMAAGGTWADIVQGVNSIPASVLGDGSGLGDPGQGGMALALTLITFGPRWKRMVWPAFFGLAAAVSYGQAGGIWGIFANAVRMAIGQATGAA